MPATMPNKRASRRRRPAKRAAARRKAGAATRGKVVRGWRSVQPLLQRWRRSAATIEVHLRRPRVIDAVPIDFLRGEVVPHGPAGSRGEPTSRFRGRLIFFTRDDITVRRSSGAILVVDNYEIAALSGGHWRFIPS